MSRILQIFSLWSVCLIVLLFFSAFYLGGGTKSRLRMYYAHGYVTITDEGLQILTYARHSWPFSSYGSLACHTYCDRLRHRRGFVVVDTCNKINQSFFL